MTRKERQAAILRLIRERPVSTQSELADALHEAGFEAVQTTVSRDIHELGLVKVRASSGRLVYAEPGASADRAAELAEGARRPFHLIAPRQRLQHRRNYTRQTADPDDRDWNSAGAGRRRAAAIH